MKTNRLESRSFYRARALALCSLIALQAFALVACDGETDPDPNPTPTTTPEPIFEVTDVRPSTATTSGLTRITLKGTEFTVGSEVETEIEIGGAPCTQIRIVSDTEMSCLSPARQEGRYDIVVTDLDGEESTLEDGLTYIATGTAVPVTLPRATIRVRALTAAPDGNLWYLGREGESNQLGKITPEGVVTEYALPDTDGGSSSLTVGADGNLWFPDGNNHLIRATLDGVTTQFNAPKSRAITLGPDENLWVIEQSDAVDVFKHDGSILESFGSYTMPEDLELSSITSIPAPNAAVIYSTLSEAQIVRRTMAGDLRRFDLSASVENAIYGLTYNQFGYAWFAVPDQHRLGKLNLTTGSVALYTPPGANARPGDTTLGPDGNLWFSEYQVGYVGRLNTTTGVFKQFNVGKTGAITVGGDGNVWAALRADGKVVKIYP